MKLIYAGANNIKPPAHDGDAGYDLYANEEARLEPPQTKTIGTGVFLKIPKGYVGIIKEKSGLAVRGVLVGGGVIDSSYRGEIKVILRNYSRRVHWFKPGDPIAQLIIIPVITPTLTYTDVFDSNDSTRGVDGFGSTTSSLVDYRKDGLNDMELKD